MKRVIFIILMFWFCSSGVKAEILRIADFDRGEKPNLISGDYGAWNKTEWDRTQFCNETITSDPRIVYGGKGCSLALDYDINSPNRPAYNGFWMRLEKIDLRPWKYLCFYVRGQPGVPFADKFVVEIKNMEGKIARFLVEGVTTEWKQVIIPLSEMNKDADFSEAYELTIVFDEKITTVKEGMIYIDEFYLYK
jgi:hypothetical protein